MGDRPITLESRLSKSILVIFSVYPSEKHPYISDLFDEVFQDQSVDMFCFHRSQQDSYHRSGSIRPGRKFFKTKGFFNFGRWIGLAVFLLFSPVRFLKIYHGFPKDQRKLSAVLFFLYSFFPIVRRKYDLVYLNAFQLLPHFKTKAIFGESQIKASLRGQDFDLHPEKYRPFLTWIDELHVLGNYQKSQVAELGFDERKVVVINPSGGRGVLSGNHEMAKKTGEVLLGSVSRCYWTKGHIIAIRAFKQIEEEFPDARYMIIGTGPELDYLRMESIRLGIADKVIFKGWLEGELLFSHFLAFDILLHLSIEEGFNNSVIQAQKLGIPCIVSNKGGLSENVIDHETGFVVDPYRLEEVVGSIKKLMADEQLRSDLGKRGSLLAESRFSLEDQVKAYKKLLFS